MVGGEGARHNFWEIWRGVRANFPLLRGEVLCNISSCETHFSAPLLIIIEQSLKVTPNLREATSVDFFFQEN